MVCTYCGGETIYRGLITLRFDKDTEKVTLYNRMECEDCHRDSVERIVMCDECVDDITMDDFLNEVTDHFE
jgi:hypothetical protein